LARGRQTAERFDSLDSAESPLVVAKRRSAVATVQRRSASGSAQSSLVAALRFVVERHCGRRARTEPRGKRRPVRPGGSSLGGGWVAELSGYRGGGHCGR